MEFESDKPNQSVLSHQERQLQLRKQAMKGV